MKRISKITSAAATAGLVLSLLAPFGAAFAADPGPTTKKTGTPPPDRAVGYQAKWLEQTQSGTTDQYYAVKPGDTVAVTAKFKNLGTNAWQQTGEDRQVCIAVYKDPNVASAPTGLGFDIPNQANYGKSYFKGTGWASDYRIGCINETEVLPGATGSFTLNFKVPSDAPGGKFREDISLASGPYWIEADGAYPQGTGDPLGIAHIWVGFNVEGTPQSNEEAQVGIDCFDTTLIPNQATACIITVADKFGAPVRDLNNSDLYLELLKGPGRFAEVVADPNDTAGPKNSTAILALPTGNLRQVDAPIDTATHGTNSGGTPITYVAPGVYYAGFKAGSTAGDA
ncbi:MAG: hypothetical protein WCP97_07505, partial [bacterium]